LHQAAIWNSFADGRFGGSGDTDSNTVHVWWVRDDYVVVEVLPSSPVARLWRGLELRSFPKLNAPMPVLDWQIRESAPNEFELDGGPGPDLHRLPE
jgi:hypothetical protein